MQQFGQMSLFEYYTLTSKRYGRNNQDGNDETTEAFTTQEYC